MLLVNQMNAQIKLTEMWKAAYCEKYPLDERTKSKSITLYTYLESVTF